MTERSWHLYWIAVSKDVQSRGLGGKMLAFVEQDVREQNGRLLLIETPPRRTTNRLVSFT